MGILSNHPPEELYAETDERRADIPLIASLVLISIIGIINVYSVTSGKAEEHLALRQILHYAVGALAITLLVALDYRILLRLAYPMYYINLAALFATKFIGTLRMGARRWIDLGPFSYQPSETMKIIVILTLARYFTNRQDSAKLDIVSLIKPSLLLGIPALLTISQPDLGTGGHILLTGSCILLFIGIQKRLLIAFAAIALISAPLAYKFGLKEYQRDRIRTFVDPSLDPKGTGYNSWQARIAVGSGQLLGKGFKKGTQTQLAFTPEGETDFIFTVLAEEWGFVGAFVLLLLYFLLFSRILAIANGTHDKFGALVCIGVLGMLGIQVFINMGMVCGLLPIVGIPLPYVSYGGTSVLTVSVALGLVLSIGYRRTLF